MTMFKILLLIPFSFAVVAALFIGTAYSVWRKGEHVDVTSLERLAETIRKAL